MAAAKPKTRQDLAMVELDGEAVIYDDRNNQLHHLNPVATVLFHLFDGTATAKEIALDIAEETGQDLRGVERHVRKLVKQFREAGLMEESLAQVRKGVTEDGG
jgi:hypothetical protein